jgi:hypothetical protein
MTNRVVIPSSKKREQDHSASCQTDLGVKFQVSDGKEHGVELIALFVLVQCWVVLVPRQLVTEAMGEMS